MNIKPTQEISLQERAEQSLQRAKEVIFEHIPEEEIVSIYGKGSYFRDEFKPGSDIDIVVILQSEEYLPELYTLTPEFGEKMDPQFQVVGYTMKELLTGKWEENRPKTTTRISRFVKYLDGLPLLYGNKPEGKLFTKSDETDMKANIDAFNKNFLPQYEAGKFSFNELVKQVFWLVEAQLRLDGIKTEYSWQALADAIPDQNHIIHQTLQLRNFVGGSEEEKKEFIEKLRKYISTLEEKVGKK